MCSIVPADLDCNSTRLRLVLFMPVTRVLLSPAMLLYLCSKQQTLVPRLFSHMVRGKEARQCKQACASKPATASKRPNWQRGNINLSALPTANRRKCQERGGRKLSFRHWKWILVCLGRCCMRRTPKGFQLCKCVPNSRD